MEQKVVKKKIAHDGISGTIKITLFTEFVNHEYINNVYACMDSGRMVYDKPVGNSKMDAAIEEAAIAIKKTIDDIHAENQELILSDLLEDGFTIDVLDSNVDVMSEITQPKIDDDKNENDDLVW